MTELNIPKFFDQVEEKQYLLTEEFPEVMQINVGSLCNITCSHCHVDGGPTRKNNMVRETFEQIIEAFKVGKYKTMDITGGAPEMNPNFRWFLKEISQHAKTIIVRTNLIILDVPAYRDIPELYRDLKVQVVASLPYYNEKVVAKQRGKGVFPKSIFLHREDLYEGYMNKLYKAYNPATLPGLMCRNMISVGPDGSLYDCDFNYIEKLKISGEVNHVSQLVDNHTGIRRIVTGMHCYGCTAGAGSS